MRDKKHLLDALAQAILELLSKNRIPKKQVAGVGIGLPGLIDPVKGIVKVLPNIPGWSNVPLKKLLQARIKIPVFLDNDVNLIALGEWKFGAGKGYQNQLCITLGTGVGGGMILNNQIYRGENFVAGEIGHMPLNEHGPQCNCGGWGCFERYVGNKTILKLAERLFRRPFKQIYELRPFVHKRDQRALRLWDEIATHLGNGLVGPINLLNPKIVIIGGGVSNNYPFFIKKVKSIIRKRAMKVQSQTVKFARAKLGDDAGLKGAYVLIHQFRK